MQGGNMSSVNKQIIVGNLGADPEVRYTNDGTCITTFNVATSEVWTNKNGEKQEETEWHKVVVFRKLAEICGEYLRKGSKVYVEGPTKTDKWEDKDGVERTSKKVKAREVKFLSSKNGESRSNSPEPPSNVDDEDIPF